MNIRRSRRTPISWNEHDLAKKNAVTLIFVLTGFGDADMSSEIRGLELRPELTPRAFPFGASARDAADH
jgi:hypothetical protein